MKNIILDTNTYSSLTKGDLKVKKVIQNADTIYIPIIVVGELYSGFFRGSQQVQNEYSLNNFLNDPKISILPLKKTTARIYGKLMSDLNIKGTPITANDVWIAACAIETDSTLITYDKHFLKVPGLKLWKGII